MGLIHAPIHGIAHGVIHWGIGREGKGMEDGLRLHANLTVGAPDAPAISRPDVLDVGMPIEHLDFEPPCDARWGHEDGRPPAQVIAYTNPCPCRPRVRLWCVPCLEFSIRQRNWRCSTCSKVLDNHPFVVSWEPLR